MKIHIFTCVFKFFRLHFTQCRNGPLTRVCTHVHVLCHTHGDLKDNLQKLVLTYSVGSQDQTPVARLGNNHPYTEPSHYLQKGAPGIVWKLSKTQQSGSETIGFKATPTSLRVSTPSMDKQGASHFCSSEFLLRLQSLRFVTLITVWPD